MDVDETESSPSATVQVKDHSFFHPKFTKQCLCVREKGNICVCVLSLGRKKAAQSQAEAEQRGTNSIGPERWSQRERWDAAAEQETPGTVDTNWID